VRRHHAASGHAANDIPASQLDTSSLAGLEDAAYTFGITNTPDPSLLEFLQAVGQWGATELGFGAGSLQRSRDHHLAALP
jgi:hypothetical protein